MQQMYQRFTKIQLCFHQTTGTFCLDVVRIHQQRDDLNFSHLGLFWFVTPRIGMFGLVHAAALWFLDMTNRDNHQAFSFLWLSEERDSHNFEQRYWQVTAKIKEMPLRFFIGFWTAVSFVRLPWHGFYKFHKCIDTNASRDNPVFQ